MSKALVIAIAIATALLAVSACVQHPIYQV
jgi:hypothetical protein